MANRVVKRSELLHYDYDYDYDMNVAKSVQYPIIQTEVDKSKSISELSDEGLQKLIYRLRNEREAEDSIRSLRRSAGEKDSYENPAKIDTITPVNQLYHFGVLGMKWGVRRFQKKDGTRTAAGKKRDRAAEAVKSDDHIKSRENKEKTPEALSNEELRKLNERLQLEATYKSLTTDKTVKSQSFVRKALTDAGGKALTEFSQGLMLGGAKLLVRELSPMLAETAFNMKEKK